MNLCGCKYAQVDNGGGQSMTWCFWCRLHKRSTDPNICVKCADKDDGKVKKMVMNKNDVISRDAVVQFIGTEAYKQMMGRAIRRAEYLTKVRDEIFKIPSLEVTPVTHAHWDQQDDTHIICSHCKETWAIREAGDYVVIASAAEFRFCPSCGARMDGVM